MLEAQTDKPTYREGVALALATDVTPAVGGLGITGGDFDRIATPLDAALEANGIADGDRVVVLEEVAALKPAVVEE